MALLLLMHVAASHVLQAEGYGTFSYVVTLVTLLSFVVSLGWPTAVARFAAEYAADGHWPHLLGLLRSSYTRVIASGLCASATLVSLSVNATGDHWRLILSAAAVALPLAMLSLLQSRTLQGLNRIGASIFVDAIGVPLAFLALLIVFRPARPGSALGLYCVSLAVAVILGFFLVRIALPGPSPRAQFAYRRQEWRAVAMPMFVGLAAQLLLGRADVLILGNISGMGAVGLFASATRLVRLVSFGLESTNVTLAPRLVQAMARRDEAALRALINRACLVSLAAALPPAALLLVAPDLCLKLFGADFSAAAPILRVLTVGQLFNAATGPAGTALQMIGAERTFAVTTVAASAMSVGTLLLIVPAFGALGAASVSALTIAALNVTQYGLLRRHLNATFRPGFAPACATDLTCAGL
jgi:O-antigen/teichoic acid export membrane protein